MNARIETVLAAGALLRGSFSPGAFRPPPPGFAATQTLSLPGLELGAAPHAVAVSARHIVACSGEPWFFDARLRRLNHAYGPAAAWVQLAQLYGDALLDHVGGAYALVLVHVDEARLTLAVDRFSIRRLCFTRQGDTLHFSERADQLGGDIAPQALFDYFHDHVIASPATVFVGVERLPAAHRLECSGQGLRMTPYWQPRFVVQQRTPTRELMAQFRTLVFRAVKRHIEGTRTGCFLSGGTDSSTVAGMMSRITGARVPTYSVGFDADGYDEMHYARLAASHFDTEHHAHYLRAEDLLDIIPFLAERLEQPFGNSSLAPAYFCAQMAAQHGSTKLLAGDGGDELFGGNTRYAEQKLFAAWGTLPAVCQRSVKWLAHHLPPIGVVGKARRYIEQAQTPLPDRLERYNLITQVGLPTIFTPRFLERIDPHASLRQKRAIFSPHAHDALCNALMAYDWRTTLADNDCPKVTQATDFAGVACGFPLLDEALVEFALALAPELKVRGLRLRYFFKQALRDFLPREILRKRKHGFGLPFGPWLLRHAGLHKMARQSLDALVERGMMNADFAQAVMADLLPRHPGYYGELIWLAVMLEHWLQGHARQLRV